MDFFKILMICECFFFSTPFLVVLALFASGIAVFGRTEEIDVAEAGAKLSLTGFYSPKEIFLEVEYSFSFQHSNVIFALRASWIIF